MRIASNKIKDIVSFFYSELAETYSKEEISYFLKYCFEDFSGIIHYEVDSDRTISESELLKFNFAVKDLKKNKPIQYIVSNAHFYGLKFFVNEHVLIPRPETEELVDLILKEHQASTSKCQDVCLLDIGTGSGCISISIKKNKPEWNVAAMDISPDALTVASKNAVLNKVVVDFIEADILDKNCSTIFEKKFDIIVSNPPYIEASEKDTILPNVLHFEPHLALFVDSSTPLLFYQSILNFAQKMLKKDGKVYFEINEKFGVQAKLLMEEKGFKNVNLVQDINNKNRILHGIFKG